YSGMLRDDLAENGLDEFVGDLIKIEKSGHMLLALVNDVLDISKVESGRLELHRETFELAPVIEEVMNAVEPLAMENGNQLDLNISVNRTELCTDLLRFRQSLLNLVSNACKFTKNGTVFVDVAEEGTGAESHLRLSVIDSGIGLTPDQIEKLFKAFS